MPWFFPFSLLRLHAPAPYTSPCGYQRRNFVSTHDLAQDNSFFSRKTEIFFPHLSTSPPLSMWAMTYPVVPFCGCRFLLMTMPSSPRGPGCVDTEEEDEEGSFRSRSILKRLLVREGRALLPLWGATRSQYSKGIWTASLETNGCFTGIGIIFKMLNSLPAPPTPRSS